MTTQNPLQHQLEQGKISKYESQYGDYIQLAADAMKEKFEYNWTSNDSLAFGQYAETWQSYRPVMEADITSRNTLGPAIQSNLGIIAMSYASLPIQNLASVQPLNDEAGTVFFRQGLAAKARGGVAAGEQLISPYGAVNSKIDSFTSETQTVSATLGADLTVAVPLTALGEIKPGSVRISVAGGKIKGIDDGEGHILGVGIDANASTINYATGAISLKLAGAAGKGIVTGDKVDVVYAHSVIDSDSIPTMKWVLTSKVVQADYYVLQSQYSNLSELVLKKRFGSDLANEITGDLVSQITSSVMNKAIASLRAAAIRNEVATGRTVVWPFYAPSGVSEADHRRTFDDKLIEATGEMYKISGKGDVSTLIVGTRGKQVLKSAGMRMIKNAVSGPHLCGMYDSVPVYYAPNTVLGDNEILVVYRGANWHEAPIVYAPFLPVTTVSGNATDNVLTNAQAAYHAAGLESVVDGFCVRVTLDMTP